jgi:hypothetical protein
VAKRDGRIDLCHRSLDARSMLSCNGILSWMFLAEADRGASARDLVVLDRLFTRAPLALALAHNDDDSTCRWVGA